MQPTTSAAENHRAFAASEASSQAVHFLIITGKGAGDIENVQVGVVEGNWTVVSQAPLVAEFCISVVTGKKKKKKS